MAAHMRKKQAYIWADKHTPLQDPERKREVVGLLGEVSDERFADLVELGKRMTDFSTEPTAEDAAAGDVLDDDIGVAVEFEGEDEDDDDDAVDEIAVSRPIAALFQHFCLTGTLQNSMSCFWRLRACQC